MLSKSPLFFGFTNGASHHTWNLASIKWVICPHVGQVFILGGAYLGPTTKNIVEYVTNIKLISNSISLGIICILVHIDSQLETSQLSSIYYVFVTSILQKYLKVKLLEINFETITYIHISGSQNYIFDAFTSIILDWHIYH